MALRAPHTLIQRVLDLLFPPACASCGRMGALLCAECRSRFVRYPRQMRRLPPALDAVWIGYVFEGPLRDAVHHLKYRGARRMAEPLANMLLEAVPLGGLDISALAPIPLHAKRQAKRGYNQAAELAGALARPAGLAVCDRLIRIRATEQQASLKTLERAANVAGAFHWGGGPVPAHVALVDDVLTTGATMNACAEALRAAGAQRVYGIALARSRPDLA